MKSLKTSLQVEAAKELLSRRLAKGSFLGFVNRMSWEPEPAKHHRLIIDKLDQVEQGIINRLMLFLPPRNGKSTYASILFPAYYLGKNPQRNVITASYAQRLSSLFGKRCRNLVALPDYQNIFGFGLSGDSAAKDEWAIARGGEFEATSIEVGGGFTATSVDGSVTGRGGHLLIADDIIKGREEAESETVRENVWEWWLSDLLTRLEPDGAIVLIMTRWHEDDPAGRILPEDYKGESGLIRACDGEIWDVVNLPALAEENDLLDRQPGEALWPERFSKEHLEQIRISQGERNWSALYQQRPSPEEGNYFKREWLRRYDIRPEHLRVYGASDYAVTEKDGDWTVHGMGGVDPMDDLYIFDWYREQTTTDIWIDALLDMAKSGKPNEWAEESGQIIKSVGPFIDKRQRETKNYFYRKQFTSSSDKPTRAQAFRGRMAQCKVYLPSPNSPDYGPWVDTLINELMSFPAGKYDDQVDVLSLFGRMLNEMIGGQVPKAKQKPRFPEEMTINEIIEQHGKLMRQDEWD